MSLARWNSIRFLAVCGSCICDLDAYIETYMPNRLVSLDDCHEDMVTHMLNALEQLETMQREDLVVEGKHFNIHFWLGGDHKLMT